MPALGSTPKNREGAIKLYDDWAKNYDETLKSWDYTAPRKTAELLKRYAQSGVEGAPLCINTLPVLDAGCGTGLSGEALHAAGFARIVGTDVSNDSLELCRGKGIYVNLVNCDLECAETGKTPFDDRSFAGVTCVGVLSYVKNFDKVFAEWCRVTAPGGFVVFTHRVQLWDGDVDAVRTAAEKSNWVKRFESEPEDYMPKNPDPTESAKRIRYLVYEVQ